VALIRDFLQKRHPPSAGSEYQRAVRSSESGTAGIGKLIPDNDIWIAAMARQFDLPLVTRDGTSRQYAIDDARLVNPSIRVQRSRR